MYIVPNHGDDLEKVAWEKAHYPLLHLDGVSYHRVESDEVPPGHSFVPVKFDDNGDGFDAMMVAGSVGINIRAVEVRLVKGKRTWIPPVQRLGGGCSSERTRRFWMPRKLKKKGRRREFMKRQEAVERT